MSREIPPSGVKPGRNAPYLPRLFRLGLALPKEGRPSGRWIASGINGLLPKKHWEDHDAKDPDVDGCVARIFGERRERAKAGEDRICLDVFRTDGRDRRRHAQVLRACA